MNYGYTSRTHDDASGLIYFRARLYDPTTGEFTSRDPLEYIDGTSLYRGYFVPSGLDPSGTLLVAIGGTASAYWLQGGQFNGRDAKVGDRWLSHVANFYEDYQGLKRFYHGPSEVFGGGDLAPIISDAKNYICDHIYVNRQEKVDVIGMSRGGGAAILSQQLADEGCQVCNCRFIPEIRFLGLYDPVSQFIDDSSLDQASKDLQIPSIVQNFSLVRAVPFEGRFRSRDGWTRPNYTWEGNPEFEATTVAATHSAIGGAPTYSSETFLRRGAFDVHGGLEGYTDRLDIEGSIKADQTIREAAIRAGVPVRPVDDYGFNNLDEWENRGILVCDEQILH